MPGSIADCPPFREGLLTVQDLVASEVARFVGAEAGERILDLCAGSGGKSTHLAEISGGGAEIVAADVSKRQLAQAAAENVARLGTPGIRPLLLGGTAFTDLPPFDRVLVDVPCSNSGVLMKRVAARYRLDEKTVLALARKELDLLERGATCVKPGGVLVYSTCSILPQEDGAVVERFLARTGGRVHAGGVAAVACGTSRAGTEASWRVFVSHSLVARAIIDDAPKAFLQARSGLPGLFHAFVHPGGPDARHFATEKNFSTFPLRGP